MTAREDFVDSRLEVYLADDGECNPFCAETFVKCLADEAASDELVKRLKPIFENGVKYDVIGWEIVSFVVGVCKSRVTQLVKEDLTEWERKHHD